MLISGRADDGADVYNITGAVAENSFLNGTGKSRKIALVTMLWALKKE